MPEVANETPPPPETPEISPQKKNKRKIWLIIFVAATCLAGLIWLIFWIFVGRFYVYTEDAYVFGNQVMLKPQITSGVKAIYADETDLVEEGQLVVELDGLNYELKYEELKESLAETVREVSALFQDVESRKAEVDVRKAELYLAELDLKNRDGLSEIGAISVEEYETYQADVEIAAGNLLLAESELEKAKSLVEGTTVETHPRVLESVAMLKKAYLDLIRCQIWAPMTGYIAKRTVQVGDQVIEGQTLLVIVPLDYLWLEANYKETQLKKVRIGQPVEFTADLYGEWLKFHGNVIGIQAGTGSAFGLLPPENAAGNWIKIIQRVPVRICVCPEEIREHPLVLGLSLRVHIDVHDIDGRVLTNIPTMEPLYTTPIYEKQMEDIETILPLINDIIQKNAYINGSNKNQLVENL